MNEKLCFAPIPDSEISLISSKRLSFLLSSMAFSWLPGPACASIGSAAVQRTFARHESLFSQRQKIRKLTLLRSGAVKQTQVSLDGEQILLRVSCAGDVVCAQGSRSEVLCFTQAQNMGMHL